VEEFKRMRIGTALLVFVDNDGSNFIIKDLNIIRGVLLLLVIDHNPLPRLSLACGDEFDRTGETNTKIIETEI